jgi:hypothetical protein
MTELTQDQVQEFIKCKDDPVYFINNYVKITSLLPAINLYDYQEDLIEKYHTNQFSITKACRQSCKSFTGIAYLLHCILFYDKVTVGIFTHSRHSARDLLIRLKEMHLNLPSWLTQGVNTSNNSALELENGSTVFAFPVDSLAGQGLSFDTVFLDEFAFVNDEKAINFWDYVIVPMIYSKTSTKVIISSTCSYSHKLKEIENEEGNIEIVKVPTLFYKLWDDAIFRRNNFIPTDIIWNQLPRKDEEWKEQMIANIGIDAFKNQYECEFLETLDAIQ